VGEKSELKYFGLSFSEAKRIYATAITVGKIAETPSGGRISAAITAPLTIPPFTTTS
jgi:hypothetical protein